MRGLTVVLASPDRLRAALELAAAQAALGGRTRVFAHGAAVAALRLADDDPAYPAAGLPTIATMFEEAIALGVAVSACQSGLALTGLTAAMLDPRIATGGLIGVLASLDDDRLVMA